MPTDEGVKPEVPADGMSEIKGESSERSLLDLAVIFLRLGFTAFGGPAAHISMMRDEFVHRRNWVSEEEFLDTLGAANLIPGPSSTEVAIFLGYRQAGTVGLLLAGICFILPAFAMVLGIARVYQHFGRLSVSSGLLYGFKPVVIAVVLQALWGLGKTAIKQRSHAALGAISLVLTAINFPPLLLLLSAGAATGGSLWIRSGRKESVTPLVPILASLSAIVALSLLGSRIWGQSVRPTPSSLLLVFIKIGASVYGSGYVLLPFLRQEVVRSHHWITSSTLLDAVAVGQMTPGPVFTTATFIGFVTAGPSGALAATVGIFLPAFLFVAISGRRIAGLRQTPSLGAFLDGVNVAAIALMAGVAWQLARAAIVDTASAGITILAAFVLLRTRINSGWVVIAGGAIGLAVFALR